MADNKSCDCCGPLNTDFGVSFQGEMVVVGSSVVVVVVVMVVMVMVVIMVSVHQSSLAIVGLRWPSLA